MKPMKALTLYPEHAELFRLRLRSIETRGWATSYRGAVLLHAGKRDPDSAAARRDPLNKVAMAAIPHGDPLTRGAIVARAELVDCLPIIEEFAEHDHERFLLRALGGLGREVLRLAERAPMPGPGIHCYDFLSGSTLTGDFTDELHLGDFTSGRFGWVFDQITPTTERCPAWCDDGRGGEWPIDDDPYYLPPSCGGMCSLCEGKGVIDPIPWRGRQGLWEWPS